MTPSSIHPDKDSGPTLALSVNGSRLPSAERRRILRDAVTTSGTTPAHTTVLPNKVRDAVQQLSVEFRSKNLAEYYKSELWSDRTFKTDAEKSYVQTGLHCVAHWNPTIPPFTDRFFATRCFTEQGVRPDNNPGSSKEDGHEPRKVYVVDAGRQPCLGRDESASTEFQPGWAVGFKALSCNTRMELDHVIWSIYSWCCEDQGKAAVDEAALVTWMGEHQDALAKQCHSLRNRVRLEHMNQKLAGQVLPVCSVTDVKSSKTGTELIYDVTSVRAKEDLPPRPTAQRK